MFTWWKAWCRNAARGGWGGAGHTTHSAGLTFWTYFLYISVLLVNRQAGEADVAANTNTNTNTSLESCIWYS